MVWNASDIHSISCQGLFIVVSEFSYALLLFMILLRKESELKITAILIITKLENNNNRYQESSQTKCQLPQQ